MIESARQQIQELLTAQSLSSSNNGGSNDLHGGLHLLRAQEALADLTRTAAAATGGAGAGGGISVEVDTDSVKLRMLATKENDGVDGQDERERRNRRDLASQLAHSRGLPQHHHHHQQQQQQSPQPLEDWLWLQLGNSWRNTGDYLLAVQCYRKALALNSANIDVLLNAAVLLQTLGYSEDAAVIVAHVVNTNPGERGGVSRSVLVVFVMVRNRWHHHLSILPPCIL